MTLPLNESLANVSSQVSTTLVQNAPSLLDESVKAVFNLRFQHPWFLACIPIAILLIIAYAGFIGLRRKNLSFFIIRSVIVLLLVISLSSPHLHERKVEVTEMPAVNIILDESPSMMLYGNKTSLLAEKIRTDLASSFGNATKAFDKISIDLISSGEKTPLGDELYRVMSSTDGSGVIMVISDGNSNFGKNPVDVAEQIGKSNTTILSITSAPLADDIYVSGIYGDPKATSPKDYSAQIEVTSTSKEAVSYKLSIYADGVKITDMQISQNTIVRVIPIKFSFNGIGVHNLKAEISSSDFNEIKSNDVMFKTVEVVEKPKILLVTNRTQSPLKNVLSELYSVDLSDRIVSNPADYSLIYLDDVNANRISQSSIEKLKESVLNGNGLIVTGGKNSFDYGNYNNSYFETLLPVLSMEKPVERRKQIAVLILMDISGSTEYGVSEEYRFTPKIDFEKALAIKILRSLDINDTVGLVAFNTLPYTVEPLDRLGERRVGMEDKILRLRFGGGTDILTSMEQAENMLKYQSVNKYLIILSDGVIRTSRIPQTIEKSRQLGAEGIHVFTVGVGFDTDENFMKAMADAGKGAYFKPEAYQRLKIEFGRGLEDEKTGLYSIDVRDEGHFITRNVNLTAELSGYNRVYEKSVAQLLLATKGGNPVLTVWNFGLGRVAALTTDDGMEWSGMLYQGENSKIISSTVNWVLGDLEKGKKVKVKTEDMSLGETSTIKVISNSRPVVKVRQKDSDNLELEVKTSGLNTYSASFRPNETGFYLVTASTTDGADIGGIAVNYPAEYGDLKPDLDALSAIARKANGRLYYEEELEQMESDVLERMRALSSRTAEQERPLYPYLIGLALLIYFIDAVVRRIRDVMRLKS